MAKPENPPAFPCEAQGDRSVPPAHDYIQTGIHTAKFPGMSLRDWFAGQALTMSQPDKPEYLADWAYRVADAMLSARQTTDREDGK